MISDRFGELGIVLPPASLAGGNHVAYVVDDRMVHVSGHDPIEARLHA
jgi:hypothetical protein